jgi:hypothetical protein
LIALTISCGSKKKDKNENQPPNVVTNPQEVPPNDVKTPPTDEKKKDPGPGATYAALYEPKNVPAQFSLNLPGSILINTSSGLGLTDEDAPLKEEEVDESPDQSSSHGLNELRYQMQDLSYRIGSFAFDIVALDKLYIKNPNCLAASGCTIADAEIAMDREMVNYVINAAGGYDAIPKEDLAYYDTLVGQPWVLGNVVVSHPVDSADGYETIAVISDESDDYKSSRRYGYSKDFSKVGIDFEDSGSFSGDDGSGNITSSSYSSSYKFNFDAKKGSLTVAQENESSDGIKWKNEFSFEKDADKVAVNGVKFLVKMNYIGSEADGSSTQITGLADDKGAFIRTEYAYNAFDYQLTLTGTALKANANYSIFPAGTTPAQLTENYWELELGSFYADEEGSQQGVWYNGPAELPAGGLEVIEVQWNYNEETDVGSQTFVDSGSNVTAFTRSKSEVKSGYEETVDASGNVTSYCFFENANFSGESYCFSEGKEIDDIDSEYADSYEEEVGDGWVPAGYVTVSVNDTLTVQSTKKSDLYIFRNLEAMSALAAAYKTESDDEDDQAAYQNLLGAAYFKGEGDEADTVLVKDVYEFSFWGNAEEAKDLILARMVFDEDGAVSFEQITAVITATVAE